MRKRILTTIIILGTATLALLGASVFAAINMTEIRAAIDEEGRRIDERYVQQRRITESVAGLDGTRRRIADFRAIGVTSGEELAFVTDVERAASQAGVDADLRLSDGGEELSDWETEMHIDIEASGQYADAMRFLETLERLPTHIIVNAISVVPGSDQPVPDRQDGSVRLTISAVVYLIEKDPSPPFVGINPAGKAPPAASGGSSGGSRDESADAAIE